MFLLILNASQPFLASQIVPAKRKELQYFTFLWSSEPLSWYLEQMPTEDELTPDKLSYEKSPSYYGSEEAAARMALIMPGTKIILAVRDPVDR